MPITGTTAGILGSVSICIVYAFAVTRPAFRIGDVTFGSPATCENVSVRRHRVRAVTAAMCLLVIVGIAAVSAGTA